MAGILYCHQSVPPAVTRETQCVLWSAQLRSLAFREFRCRSLSAVFARILSNVMRWSDSIFAHARETSTLLYLPSPVSARTQSLFPRGGLTPPLLSQRPRGAADMNYVLALRPRSPYPHDSVMSEDLSFPVARWV